MKYFPLGGQRLCFMLLLALSGVVPGHAQSPPPSSPDATFLATLGELREADYSTKASIVERLSQGGHPSVRAVLTAFMEDRLYFRNNDQKVFIAKAADEDPLNLIDPVSLKDSGSASGDSMTKIGTNNGLRRTLRIRTGQSAGWTFWIRRSAPRSCASGTTPPTRSRPPLCRSCSRHRCSAARMPRRWCSRTRA